MEVNNTSFSNKMVGPDVTKVKNDHRCPPIDPTPNAQETRMFWMEEKVEDAQ